MQTINVLLLVDGNESDVLATESKIQGAHLPVGEVVVAHNLAECKQILQSRAIDVVLLDLDLSPKEQGLDTLLAVRAIYDGIVIVLTNRDSEQTGIDAIRLGAEDYLVKSRLSPEWLRQSIAYAQIRHQARATACRIQGHLDRLDDLASRSC